MISSDVVRGAKRNEVRNGIQHDFTIDSIACVVTDAAIQIEINEMENNLLQESKHYGASFVGSNTVRESEFKETENFFHLEYISRIPSNVPSKRKIMQSTPPFLFCKYVRLWMQLKCKPL